MKRPILNSALASVVLVCAGSAQMANSATVLAAPRGVAPPQSHPHGASYAEWSARWWTWALELPVAGHPFIDSPDFQVTSGQSGHVWFLGAPFGTVERTCTIPHGTALFFALLDAEWSSLEGFPTEAEQRAEAIFFADHIRNLFCTIDGAAVTNLADFRTQSPQFSFNAPTPWIEGETGGAGTSVADGYYVFLNPLSTGHHELHYGGEYHFSIAEGDPFDLDLSLDMTYHLNVGR